MYPWCNKIALTAEHVAEYLSRRCGGSKMDKCKDGGTFSYLFSIFIYDISGTFCPHTLGVCELWCPPFNESMKFGILTQFWGLGHFLCSHRYDRGNLAFKKFYSTLHAPPLWTSRRLFFCFCFCIAFATSLASCLAANLRAQGMTGLPVEEPTTVSSNQRHADATSSACPQQCPHWHTNLSQPLFGWICNICFPFSLKPIKFHGFIKKWRNH